MGMYTELNCAFALSKNTPGQIINILLYMTGQSSTEPETIPPHPLFGDTRWNHMLRGASAYFDGEPHSMVRLDEFSDKHRVTIRCNFKNYDDELEKFIDWITPHIDALPGDFLGYKRYEDTEMPTLLYHPGLFITPLISEEILSEAAMETAWGQGALPRPRSCLEAERERVAKGHRPHIALQKWGPEIEAQIMSDLAGKK
jgi:hypothetical protein